MVDLSKLELTHENHTKAFEDIATLMFCIHLGLSSGVNKRINQEAIESEPVTKNGKIYAYQAKYYASTTTLSKKINDFKKSIVGASVLNVTDLYFFINKDLPDKCHKTKKDPRFIQEIEDTAKKYNIKLDWWTKSRIETTLDFQEYSNVKNLYFTDSADEKPTYAAFYSYIYDRFSESPQSTLFGNIPLQQSYIEPFVCVEGKMQTVHKCLEAWVNNKEKITIICGEPGHGKTSLCHKAMCDFYKNGWLAGKVSNVFCFSLNPAKTNALNNDSFNIYSLLCWGDNRNNKKHILDESDCKGALVFFDGFDELIEWYPKFDLKSFIERDIVPFQKETGAYIVITSRSMVVEPNAEEYSLQDGRKVPIQRLQLITKAQQFAWIQQYAEYCRKTSASEAKRIENYLESYRKLNSEDLNRILGVPVIFRLIVASQYMPNTEKSITQIYDTLFDSTWLRSNKRHATEDDKIDLKKKLQNHALQIFIDNNDTAKTVISISCDWLFSFYTTHENAQRVGFLHRSFYQYFLAHEILGWYRNAATNINSKDCIDNFKNNLSNLARRKLDSSTLSYIKELYEQNKDKESIIKAIDISYDILKMTDGFLPVCPDIEKSVIALKRANYTFENIVSIGSLCGRAISLNQVNEYPLRLYELDRCILVCAQLGKSANSVVNLQRAYFKGADLRDANLSGADLKEIELSEANLRAANLSGACLNGATLVGAALNKANLNGANLDGTMLIGSTFDDAILCNATLNGVDLSYAKLNKANFCNTNLCNACLCNASFKNANLRNANLSYTDLSDADFSYADLSLVNLNHANCDYVDYSDSGFDISIDYYRNATFEHAILQEANLSYADLRKATFIKAKLQNADFRHANLYKADFTNVDLQDADLRFANLCDANFTNANLQNADLRHANLCNTDFTDANLQNANLCNANFIDVKYYPEPLFNENFKNAQLDKARIDPINADYLSDKYDITKLNIMIDDDMGLDIL